MHLMKDCPWGKTLMQGINHLQHLVANSTRACKKCREWVNEGIALRDVPVHALSITIIPLPKRSHHISRTRVN